jgi:NAD(P)-dependent dehydrogenase (short-subunit alcohol dehydrogenase family)
MLEDPCIPIKSFILRVKATADAIKKEAPKAELKELVLDLGSQKAVRQAADEVLKYSGPIDVLILNAGVVPTIYLRLILIDH